MNRRRWVVLSILFLASLLVLYLQVPTRAPRHNVLLITLDTTRADHLGCYGYPGDITPRLDELARESVRFDRAVAQASNTPVSHASILTGRNPYRHGLRVMHGNEENHLPEGETTLAEVWSAAGGTTAAFVSAFPAGPAFGLGQGFEFFDAAPESGKSPVTGTGMVETGLNQRRGDVTTDAALDCLSRDGRDRRFLLWVHYFDPHDPQILPPAEVLGRFQVATGSLEDQLRAIYAAEVSYMDGQIGRILDWLREEGLWSSTIVVVVADHGEGLGDHDWWSHGILYEEQIRVPLIIRVPGVTTGTSSSLLVRTIDVMPTILSEAGISRWHWPVLDGLSLAPELRGIPRDTERVAYSDSVNLMLYSRPGTTEPDPKTDKLYAIVTDRWKLIHHQLRPGESELYDLESDPAETNNLYAHGTPVRGRLRNALIDLEPFSDFMPHLGEADDEHREKLRSLGYLQ